MTAPSPSLRHRVTVNVAARRRALRRRLRAELTWSRLYRATSYAKSALWLVPLFAIALVVVAAPLLRELDKWLGWKITGLDVEGAQALFQTVITLTLSFLVFTFGSLLVAIQIAGGQLTPRIIATTLLRDNVVRYSVGLFVFTLVLSVSALNRIQNHVNEVVVLVLILLGITSMCVFLFLIDYAARLLRPVTILGRVGDGGCEVIKAMYPDALGERDEPSERPAADPLATLVAHEGRSGVLLAVDLTSLVAEARRHGGVIEVLPRVGDFVATGEPVLRLHGGAAAIPAARLLAAVAFGPERTVEQDPLFALRIAADIGLKALSPAINDPTTAVLAIDQIHRMLRVAGRRRLRGDTVVDDEGAVRVVLRTPDWEDFVHLACREIRACGASSMQVARRLNAMFEDLLRLLPLHRRPALEMERQLLDRLLQQLYPFPEDLALARVPDIQGLGSPGTEEVPGGLR